MCQSGIPFWGRIIFHWMVMAIHQWMKTWLFLEFDQSVLKYSHKSGCANTCLRLWFFKNFYFYSLEFTYKRGMVGLNGNTLFTFMRIHCVQQWLPQDLWEWFSLCSGGRVLSVHSDFKRPHGMLACPGMGTKSTKGLRRNTPLTL